MAKVPKLTFCYSVDVDVLQSYLEYFLFYYCRKEGACLEEFARLSVVDNASKNDNEMIEKPTMTFNKTRQSVITGGLIEIISWAATL
jgi:F0F1-type ATP synthase gamma subunit